ncbi:hypothetical protein H4R20_006604, partial [Coemansia guatemalensis]
QFTQQETVLLGASGSGQAARTGDGAAQALHGESSNAFNPRMHASIMFSRSDRVLGGETSASSRSAFANDAGPPLSQNFLTQESIYDASQFTQDAHTQNFTQY